MLLIFQFSVLIFQCGFDVEDPTPPSPPVWVQKSLPEQWPEQGIDAHESGGLFLEWYSNDSEDIKGYHLRKARYFDDLDSLGSFGFTHYIENTAGNTIQFVDETVWGRVKYFFILESENESGTFSGPSDTISYSILPAIRPETMVPNGSLDTLNEARELSWIYYYAVEMENYTVTILDFEGKCVLREEFSPSSFTGYNEKWRIPDALTLENETRYQWRIDIGAAYQDGYETVGAESLWAIFYYKD